jgi:histidinol-phosphate/aromatic aminotransferase/cobyric acid decarboxylase-like protein
MSCVYKTVSDDDSQYKEYYRSAETAEMKILSGDSTERANVLCIVNPCNPTGDYMPLDQIKTWINDNVYDGGFVIVGKLFVINAK